MAERRQCEGRVHSRLYPYADHQCERNGSIKPDGKFYCRTHDPEKIREHRKARQAKDDAKLEKLEEMWKRPYRQRRAGELGIKLAEFIEEHLLSNGDTQGKAIDMALEVIDTLNGEKQ